MARAYELVLSRRVLRTLLLLNPIFGFLIFALLTASLIAEAPVMTALGVDYPPKSHGLVLAMQSIMVIGIIGTGIAQIALNRLLRIVETVSGGDPFVIVNAERLKTIAWSILALEVLHVVVGILAHRINSSGQPLDIDWHFSVTRWLSVLFLFVLAKVFEQGARMREDLEGTV